MADHKLVVVVGTDGEVIATARPTSAEEAPISTGVAALPGQRIHEVTLPEEELEGMGVDELHDHIAANYLS
jgi:hypothetical protein